MRWGPGCILPLWLRGSHSRIWGFDDFLTLNHLRHYWFSPLFAEASAAKMRYISAPFSFEICYFHFDGFRSSFAPIEIFTSFSWLHDISSDISSRSLIISFSDWVSFSSSYFISLLSSMSFSSWIFLFAMLRMPHYWPSISLRQGCPHWDFAHIYFIFFRLSLAFFIAACVVADIITGIHRELTSAEATLHEENRPHFWATYNVSSRILSLPSLQASFSFSISQPSSSSYSQLFSHTIGQQADRHTEERHCLQTDFCIACCHFFLLKSLLASRF